MSGVPILETGVRRVLAAFDAATSDSASLSALAEMAALLQARLELLYVEDSALEQVAGLPAARQINLRTGAGGPIAPDELAAEIRSAEARLRRRLAEAAAKRQLSWSVRTVRGEAGDALLTASEAADLLVLRLPPGWERHRSSPAESLSVARQARQSVLLLEQGVWAPRAIAVLCRPGTAGTAAVTLAIRLAAAGRRPLDVLVPKPEPLDAARTRINAIMASTAARPGLRPRISSLAAKAPPLDIAGRARDGLLVVDAGDPILQQTEAWERLREIARSLLLVR